MIGVHEAAEVGRLVRVGERDARDAERLEVRDQLARGGGRCRWPEA